jgi:hypothetical protein
MNKLNNIRYDLNYLKLIFIFKNFQSNDKLLDFRDLNKRNLLCHKFFKNYLKGLLLTSAPAMQVNNR